MSNLSQAIRFIVDNDFFEGVELKPGDSERILITELAAEVASMTNDAIQERASNA